MFFKTFIHLCSELSKMFDRLSKDKTSVHYSKLSLLWADILKLAKVQSVTDTQQMPIKHQKNKFLRIILIIIKLLVKL